MPEQSMPDPERPELIAIFTATEEEMEPLRERVSADDELKDGPRRYQRGQLHGVQVVLVVTGEGKRNADLVARRVVQLCWPTRILALGLGGALSPKLAPESILISSEVMEGGSTLAWPDLAWLDEAALTMEHDLGRLVTVDEILTSPAMKDEWWGKTMRDQPAACDMESACFARVASAYQIPYLVVRSISDGAEETLPHFLEDCRAQDGRIDRRQVFWKAFWRPRSWRVLWRLNGRMKRGAEQLADVADQLVAAVAKGPRR